MSTKTANSSISERPIDPSRNAEDTMDPTGMTGLTTGSPQQTSAEPDDTLSDTENLPGRIMSRTIKHNPYGISLESEDDLVYEQNMRIGMSPTARQNSLNQASIKNTPIPGKHQQTSFPSQDDHADANIEEFVNETTIHETSPSVQGEQSVSGDMPDPESDDDTLQNAHLAGFQLDEDLEHPKEVDIARDIDTAEENLRTH